MPDKRKRDPRQVNMAIGMSIGLIVGAVGMYLCTITGYTDYATVCLIACMVIGGIIGAMVKVK